MPMYVAAVVAHAVFGAVAIAAGVVAFERPPRALAAYLVAPILMLAFLVAAALDLGAPSWLVALTGVAVALVGHRFLGRRIAVLHDGPRVTEVVST